MKTYDIRPLFDDESSTWSYIVYDIDARKALIIDPVLDQFERDFQHITEMGLTLAYVLETHVHADHVTAASAFKDRCDSQIVYGAFNDIQGADHLLKEGQEVRIGKTALKVISTPGHTKGCVCYHAPGALFTGDTLMVRACGRTDFQDGSAQTLYKSVHDKIFSLPEGTKIYPAHDYKGMLCSTIGEEKTHNPRLGNDKSESEFVEIMQNLNLEHPKKIDIAVPANLKAGRLSAVV